MRARRLVGSIFFLSVFVGSGVASGDFSVYWAPDIFVFLVFGLVLVVVQRFGWSLRLITKNQEIQEALAKYVIEAGFGIAVVSQLVFLAFLLSEVADPYQVFQDLGQSFLPYVYYLMFCFIFAWPLIKKEESVEK